MGAKRVLEAGKRADLKGLNVVVGLQRHYQNNYREIAKRLHNNEMGKIISGQVYWNSGGVWVREREPGQTEMEYQMRNWYYFNWLCGDHITEQHIHNLDVMNWFKGAYPVKAQGMGGRQVRTGKEYGEIYDHNFVEYQYDDGSIMNSQCRHIKGTYSRVDEMLVGTKGVVKCGAAEITSKGKSLFKFDKSKENQPYQNEHDELFAAIAKGEYKFADTENGAKSTLTAIMGRMAAYTGKNISWEQALNSQERLGPEQYAWSSIESPVPVYLPAFSRSAASACRFSRFTTHLTGCTLMEPRPIRAALAILGRPANRPPVFPMLLVIKIPVGVSARAVLEGGWFMTLSRMTS
jgi:predicted dehydrogenase